jgi:hypothetical protein
MVLGCDGYNVDRFPPIDLRSIVEVSLKIAGAAGAC